MQLVYCLTSRIILMIVSDSWGLDFVIMAAEKQKKTWTWPHCVSRFAPQKFGRQGNTTRSLVHFDMPLPQPPTIPLGLNLRWYCSLTKSHSSVYGCSIGIHRRFDGQFLRGSMDAISPKNIMVSANLYSNLKFLRYSHTQELDHLTGTQPHSSHFNESKKTTHALTASYCL